MLGQGHTSVVRHFLSYLNRPGRVNGSPMVIGRVPLQWGDGLRSSTKVYKSSRLAHPSPGVSPVGTIRTDGIDSRIKVDFIGERFKQRTLCMSLSLRSMRSCWKTSVDI